MITAPNWVTLQQRLDTIVDSAWSEPVEIHPWTNQGYSQEGGPDPSRAVIITNGMYVTAGSGAVGEVSIGAGAGESQQIEQDVWLSIQAEALGAYLLDWKADDRVFWPFRNLWYTVTYMPPSGTLRPNVHMTVLNNSVLASATMKDYSKKRLATKLTWREKPHRRKIVRINKMLLRRVV